MWFQTRRQIRPVPLNDFPSRQHTTGLSADEAGPDHPGADIKVVLREKVLMDEFPHAEISGQHDAAHLVTGVADIGSVFIEKLGALEEAVPAVSVEVGRGAELFIHCPVETTALNTSHDGSECLVLRIIPVRKEHGGGFPVPDFERPHIDFRFTGEDIQKQLGGVPDSSNSLRGMFPADNGEPRHGIQLEEIGAGQTEKVPHHKVCGPCRLQFREAVKDKKCAFPLFGDEVVNGHSKLLEAIVEWNADSLHFGIIGYKRRVIRKSHISDIPMVSNSLFGKFHRKGTEGIKIRDP